MGIMSATYQWTKGKISVLSLSSSLFLSLLPSVVSELLWEKGLIQCKSCHKLIRGFESLT